MVSVVLLRSFLHLILRGCRRRASRRTKARVTRPSRRRAGAARHL